ncbi:MAG: hypothetical protein QM767_24510 [Anaeromyxobacter sp.]
MPEDRDREQAVPEQASEQPGGERVEPRAAPREPEPTALVADTLETLHGRLEDEEEQRRRGTIGPPPRR